MKKYKFEEDYDVAVTESLEFEESAIGYNFSELYKYFQNQGMLSIRIENRKPYESYDCDIYKYPAFKVPPSYEYSGEWPKNRIVPSLRDIHFIKDEFIETLKTNVEIQT